MVYWSEIDAAAPASEFSPHSRAFPAGALAQALAFAEDLRRNQASGRAIRFITLCSENPDSVGKAGVADPPADYAWKKRRP